MTILRLFRWHSFVCPKCDATYQRSLSPYPLGPGMRRCERCFQEIRDGSREWPELEPVEKFKFLFPMTVIGWRAGTVVVGIGRVLASWPDEHAAGIGLFSFGFFALPWVPYFV